jgi:uncharacterized protein YndB with AHSA1/START domain
MERLPYIDEHATDVGGASREQVWRALTEVLRRELHRGEPIARALGCEPATGSTMRFDGSPGQTLPGFRVAEAEPARRLVLRGRHRFSQYELTFLLDDGRLRARTHAAFPGPLGRLYRAAVIGSGGHRIVTRRLLRQVARRA